MKSSEAWSKCFNWHGQTEKQISHQIAAIQRDAMKECAEIVQQAVDAAVDFEQYHDAMKIHDAILKRSEEV